MSNDLSVNAVRGSATDQIAVSRTQYGIVIWGHTIARWMLDAIINHYFTKTQQKAVVMDPGIANFYGGRCWVFANDPASADLWRDWIESHLISSDPDMLARWGRGTDTGISSRVIFAVLTGRTNAYARSGDGAIITDTPQDADDFGRCYRLMERFPQWSKRLGEVANKHPNWAPLIARWDELADAYQANDGPRCNKILNEVNAR